MRLIFAVLILAFLSITDAIASDLNADFKTMMTKKYMEGDFHGGILYSDTNGDAHKLALGLANPDTGKALSVDHRFGINSMGKMFTAILIMQLVEEDKIELSDPLAKHLPEYEHSKAPNITVHQLLSHRSGIPDALINQIRGILPWELSVDEQIEAVFELPLDFEPGTGFHYTNIGYELLGRIVLKYRDGNYEEILTEYIFTPLNMSESSITDNQNMPAYFSGDGSIKTYTDDMSSVGPGSGVASLSDMHKFLSSVDSDKLLSKESWKLMFTPHSLPSEVPEGAWPPPHQDPYGYGFSVITLSVDDKEYTLVGHGGAGYGSNFAGRILGTKKVVVIYNNIMKNPMMTDVFDYVARQ